MDNLTGLTGHPFTNFPSPFYVSSTTHTAVPADPWGVSFFFGNGAVTISGEVNFYLTLLVKRRRSAG